MRCAHVKTPPLEPGLCACASPLPVEFRSPFGPATECERCHRPVFDAAYCAELAELLTREAS